MMLAATRDIVIGVCFGVAALTVMYGIRCHNWGDNQDDDDE